MPNTVYINGTLSLFIAVILLNAKSKPGISPRFSKKKLYRPAYKTTMDVGKQFFVVLLGPFHYVVTTNSNPSLKN